MFDDLKQGLEEAIEYEKNKHKNKSVIIIYDMDNVYVKDTADTALSILLELYGEKLGKEAYNTIKNAPIGTRYRKHGGPLVCVVSEKEVDNIK